MSGESKLLEKLSFRQNLENVRQIVKLIHDMDNSFWAWNVVSAVMAVALTYGGMLLSAYVLNQISGGFVFSQLLRNVLLAAVGMSLGWLVVIEIDRRIGIRSTMISEKYDVMRQEKLMDMDFSLIDSPRFKELQERIRMDSNWGNGIYTLFYRVKDIVRSILQFVVAVIIGFPMFSYFRGTSPVGMGAAVVLLAVGLICCVRALKYFTDMTHYTMFHIPTKEEKGFLWNYTWEFACWSRRYQYKNGKDARIYSAYPILKYWTYDKMQTKEFKDFCIKRSAVGYGGSGGVRSAMYVLSLVGAYLIVAMAALQGEMPLGSVVLYAGCLTNILGELTSFVFLCNDVSLEARKQMGILELLKLSDEMYKGSLPMEKRSDNEYRIEFRNVSFKYPGSGQYALKNFSMELRVGEKLAIVGRNGSGKTTMIKLLCRLYDPDEGEILINGVDIKKFRHDEYSKLFSVVFQDYVLFSLMLAENIAVDKEYDEEKVKRCLEDAGFGERLAEMGEKGIRNYLYKDYTDEGIEVSGGEAQKLAIARAIYKEAPFVLLDEPTAALDPIAESEIYTNFDRIAGDKTAIYISHRLSSCRFCDKIAVFDRGELVQTGSHEELLAEENGVYAALWNAQAKYYEQV